MCRRTWETFVYTHASDEFAGALSLHPTAYSTQLLRNTISICSDRLGCKVNWLRIDKIERVCCKCSVRDRVYDAWLAGACPAAAIARASCRNAANSECSVPNFCIRGCENVDPAVIVRGSENMGLLSGSLWYRCCLFLPLAVGCSGA